MFTLLKTFTPKEGLAEPLVHWHWKNLLPQENSLRVSYGDSIFVAVGESGAILTSSDGTAWTSRASGTNHSLCDAAYGNGTFVVVGDGGTVLTSPDGITWTSRISGTDDTLSGVAFGASDGPFLRGPLYFSC